MHGVLLHSDGPSASSDSANYAEEQSRPNTRRGKGKEVEELHKVQARAVLSAIALIEERTERGVIH
jgi:hypothetical protein